MATNAIAIPRPRAAFWTGRVLSALCALFLAFDAVMHIVNPWFVVEASRRLGYAPAIIRPIGIAELLCLLAYVFPRTAVLGTVLLTGYLGGAVATQVRIGSPSFLFPVVIAVLLWGGLYLRDERIRALLPFRTKGVH